VDAWPRVTDKVPTNLHVGLFKTPGEMMGRFMIRRHGRAINVAFADGHASKVPLEELWDLHWSPNYVPPKPRPKLPK
jgi:prepilin-type processing-associated H-X9-DG protein